MKKIIGGEYFYLPSIFLKKKKFDLREYLESRFPDKNYYYTGGGYSSINTIIEEIGFEKDMEILLPSYLCSSMLIPFKDKSIKYRFYKVNNCLDIDLEDLGKRINEGTKAILFINYFGFPPRAEAVNFLKKIKEEGVVVVEDNVQSFFSKIDPIGDYFFNSFRKYCPIDGSVIISDKVIRDEHWRVLNSKYLLLKSLGQVLRMSTIKFNIFDFSSVFLKLFRLADNAYYKHANTKFCRFNKYLLSKYDVSHMVNKRRENYMRMLKTYSGVALFNELESEVVPFGFPICVKNRDLFRKKLISKNIFCPIHWVLSDEIDKDEFSESWELSKTILTLPLSENISSSDLDYLEKNMEDLHGSLS